MMIQLRDRRVSVMVEVVRTFAIFTVPVLLLPVVLDEKELAIGLVLAWLVVVGAAITLVTLAILLSVGLALWRSRRLGNPDLNPPPDPPVSGAGMLAPLAPTPVLVDTVAKPLPREDGAG